MQGSGGDERRLCERMSLKKGCCNLFLHHSRRLMDVQSGARSCNYMH